ncbi:MAG: N-acetylmuramoyl-L-alanine amidase [Limnochordia bacterium]|jgi:hypothetical protein
MRVCLDPGHGGNDLGAVGPTGLSEAQVTLSACLCLRDHFTTLGHQALLTRETDEALSEDAEQDRYLRRQKAKLNLCEVLVSIHCGMSEDPDVGGLSTLYNRSDAYSALLATHVQRGLASASSGLADLGILPVADLQHVRSLHAPAIVVQLGYISNPREEALLTDPAWIDKMAEAIARSVATWYEERVGAAQEEDEDPMTRKKQEQTTDEAPAADEDAEETSAADQAPAEEAKHEESSLPPGPGVSKSLPQAVRVTPVIRASLNVPSLPDVASAARATRSMPSAQLTTTSSQSSVIGLPGSGAVSSSPLPAGSGSGGRSAAAQGIRVTTTVRKPPSSR